MPAKPSGEPRYGRHCKLNGENPPLAGGTRPKRRVEVDESERNTLISNEYPV
jgi:hypothetical protein